MIGTVLKALISAAVIVTVAEVSRKFPRLGALLLTLPIVSLLAFVTSWTQHHDLPSLSKMSRETLILVPLGLPFFIPLAFAERWGLGFWQAFLLGILLATFTIGTWFGLTSRG